MFALYRMGTVAGSVNTVKSKGGLCSCVVFLLQLSHTHTHTHTHTHIPRPTQQTVRNTLSVARRNWAHTCLTICEYTRKSRFIPNSSSVECDGPHHDRLCYRIAVLFRHYVIALSFLRENILLVSNLVLCKFFFNF